MEKQKIPSFQLSGEAVEELNCVVCLENKTLLLLPCQHRCCKGCTDNIRGEASSFTCPICRRDVQVPPEGLPVCMLTEYLKNQLKIVQEGCGGDKFVSGNKDQCEICNKNEAEMKCRQCKKFLCCRCSLKSKCESCEGSRHDVEDIEDLVTAADSKLQAWVQATEKELTVMEEKLKQLHKLQQDYQKKKTLLSSVRTVLESDISVVDRLGIINQLATCTGPTTDGAQALPTLDGHSASKDQLNIRNIITTSAVAYSFYKQHASDKLWIILDKKRAGIVVGTHMGNIVSFLTNQGVSDNPYVIDEENKLPLYGGSGTRALASADGILLHMDSIGSVKIWENVLPYSRRPRRKDSEPVIYNKLIASLFTNDNSTACAQIDPGHVYVGDYRQKLIVKYKLEDSRAVLVLQQPDVSSPSVLLGDTKRSRVYTFSETDQRLHMFTKDEHQWATQLVSLIKLAVREEDGKVFFIGKHRENDSNKYKLVIVDPTKGAVLCDRDISDLYNSIVAHPSIYPLQDLAVIENNLWFVTSNQVTRVMLM